jgi:hypothetical protein
MLTKNTIKEAKQMPIIGKTDRSALLISKKFAKLYRRAIKNENRKKLLGYNLLVPNHFRHFKSTFREDIMMLEVKVSNHSSILLPSFYCSEKNLKIYFSLNKKDQLKNIFENVNGRLIVKQNVINEAISGTSAANQQSTRIKHNTEITAGIGDEISAKVANEFLESQFGETLLKKTAKVLSSMTKIIPVIGNPTDAVLKGAINTVMSKGKYNQYVEDLTANDPQDMMSKSKKMIATLISDNSKDKQQYVDYITQIVSNPGGKANTNELIQGFNHCIDELELTSKFEDKLNKTLDKWKKHTVAKQSNKSGRLRAKGGSFTFGIKRFDSRISQKIDEYMEKTGIKDAQATSNEGSLPSKFMYRLGVELTKGLVLLTLIGAVTGESVGGMGLDQLFLKFDKPAVSKQVETPEKKTIADTLLSTSQREANREGNKFDVKNIGNIDISSLQIGDCSNYDEEVSKLTTPEQLIAAYLLKLNLGDKEAQEKERRIAHAGIVLQFFKSENPEQALSRISEYIQDHNFGQDTAGFNDSDITEAEKRLQNDPSFEAFTQKYSSAINGMKEFNSTYSPAGQGWWNKNADKDQKKVLEEWKQITKVVKGAAEDLSNECIDELGNPSKSDADKVMTELVDSIKIDLDYKFKSSTMIMVDNAIKTVLNGILDYSSLDDDKKEIIRNYLKNPADFNRGVSAIMLVIQFLGALIAFRADISTVVNNVLEDLEEEDSFTKIAVITNSIKMFQVMLWSTITNTVTLEENDQQEEIEDIGFNRDQLDYYVDLLEAFKQLKIRFASNESDQSEDLNISGRFEVYV